MAMQRPSCINATTINITLHLAMQHVQHLLQYNMSLRQSTVGAYYSRKHLHPLSMILMIMLALAAPAHHCHRVTWVSTHALAFETISLTTIAVAHSASTHPLLIIATQRAHIGGLHPGSLQSTAIEQQHCSAALGKAHRPCLEVLAFAYEVL